MQSYAFIGNKDSTETSYSVGQGSS